MNDQLASFAFKIEWYGEDLTNNLDLFFFALKTATIKFKRAALKQSDRYWNFFGRHVFISGRGIQLFKKPVPSGACELYLSPSDWVTFMGSKYKNKIIEGAISFASAVLHEAKYNSWYLYADYSIDVSIIAWDTKGNYDELFALTFNSLSNNTHK